MILAALRLARGGTRADAARSALMVAGMALATGLLLAALTVLSVSGNETGRYHDLIDQAGLRAGTGSAFVLLVIPVLVFLGMCSRIGAATRDRRLAALRLADATPGQVRALTAADAGVWGTAGAVAGLVCFFGVRGVLAGLLDPARPGIPVDVVPPLPAVLAVLVAVPLLAAAAATLALRRVVTNPLGVSRRGFPRAPRPWGLAVLGLGLLTPPALSFVADVGIGTFAVSALLIVVGLVGSATPLTALTGLVLVRLPGPAALLAGRRL